MKIGDTLLKVAAKAVEKNAYSAAEMVSRRGWYETKVPKKLLKLNKQKH